MTSTEILKVLKHVAFLDSNDPAVRQIDRGGESVRKAAWLAGELMLSGVDHDTAVDKAARFEFCNSPMHIVDAAIEWVDCQFDGPARDQVTA